MQVARAHIDAVADSPALPRSLAATCLTAETQVKRARNLGLTKPRQPLELTLSEAPFSLLDTRCDGQKLAVEILKCEHAGWRSVGDFSLSVEAPRIKAVALARI